MRYVLLSLCFFSLVHGNEFDSKYNHYSGNTLNEIAVIGERCSGTNFTRDLMKEYFPSCATCINWLNERKSGIKNKYGHKHFFPWTDLTLFGIAKKSGPLDYSFLENSQNCLFICIVRNLSDWLRSFYLAPHHVDRSLLTQGRYHFISSEWRLLAPPVKDADLWNPYEERPFSNVLELRKYKILNYLQIGSLVDNFLFVRYEDVANNPQEFIRYISDNFKLESNKAYRSRPYHKKNYPPFTEEELNYIRCFTDWETEALIGYLDS